MLSDKKMKKMTCKQFKPLFIISKKITVLISYRFFVLPLNVNILPSFDATEMGFLNC